VRKRNPYGLKRDERGIWHCDFYPTPGQRFQRSCGTTDKTAAQEWCAKVARDSWREVRLGETPPVTWDHAVVEWFKQKERDGKRDLSNDADKARFFLGRDGAQQENRKPRVQPLPVGFKGVLLSAITGPRIDDILDECQDVYEWTNGTRNRYRSFLVGLFNFAVGKGWLSAAPKITRVSENTPPPRPLVGDEWARLRAELPIHLLRPARFSLACGARQSNVFGLRWFSERYDEGSMVPHVSADLTMMIVPSAHSKNKKMLRIPLNDEARAVLREARACADHGHAVYAFTYYGEPILQPSNTAWYSALERAGIAEFKWHGLRSTWTTKHLERGTPMEVVAKLGGWSSIAVLLKHYASFSNALLARYAGNSVGEESVIAAVEATGTDGEIPCEKNGVTDGIRTHNNRNHNLVILDDFREETAGRKDDMDSIK
jgi:integrase